MLWLREGGGQSRRVEGYFKCHPKKDGGWSRRFMHNLKCWPGIDEGLYEGQLRRNDGCIKC
jgi:hypothetical protein